MTPRPAKRRLRLESLEVRALLAGDVGSDLAQAMAAVHGSAPVTGSLDPRSTNHLFELSGHGTEELIIDLNRLPSFVTKLSISNFASVTMSGTDSLQYLIASDIQSLFAPHLSVEAATHLTNVASVDLASAGQAAFVFGNTTDFSVRSLQKTTIYSDLQTLTITSETKTLDIDVFNPSQIIQVTYHPESMVVSGIDSPSAVRFVDFSAPQLPDSVTDGDAGGDIVVVPSNPGGEIAVPDNPTFIIINRLDEKTRSLLAELRESIKVSSKDSQRLLVELLNHSAPEANQAGSTVANLRPVMQANPRELEVALQGSRMASVGSLSDVAAGPITIEVLANQETAAGAVADPSLELTDATLPLGLELSPLVQMDATWPVAVSVQSPSENAHPFVPLGLGEIEPVEVKLDDSIRAFTDYVVERFTAEFSPGQQSFVLLVDPKPTRQGPVNQGSALDLFGSATRDSIASLRQVMS